MKAVTYRHDYGSDLNREDEMIEKFGRLLVSHDTSEDYQEETSSLFVNDKGEYTWIDSNGCSCWDGDYDGWVLTKEEMLPLVEKSIANKYDWRDTADYLVAKWAKDNIYVD